MLPLRARLLRPDAYPAVRDYRIDALINDQAGNKGKATQSELPGADRDEFVHGLKVGAFDDRIIGDLDGPY